MPKRHAPQPPPTGDTPPDSPAPPPPGPLTQKRSQSSISSWSSVGTQGSDMGLNTLDSRTDYRKLRYFYSNFTNQEEVCQYLSHHSKKTPGYFLLRPSFSNRSSISISTIVSDKTVRHTNIKIEGGSGTKFFYLVPEVKFHSVHELITYYSQNEVKNLQKVNNVRFLYPLEKRNSERNGSVSREESGSSASGSHYQSPQDVSAGAEHPPALPSRPRDLPRLSSQQSMGLSSPSSSSLNSYGSPEGMHNGSISGSQMSLASGGSGSRGRNHASTSSIDSRPPAQLPVGHTSKDGNPYYSSPRNVDEDITNRLKEVLKQNEVCDCGIPRDKAELPLGWQVHRSKDPATFGRIFFQNSKGMTSWKLPAEVQSKLNIVQQQNLEDLRNEAMGIPIIPTRRVISDVTKF